MNLCHYNDNIKHTRGGPGCQSETGHALPTVKVWGATTKCNHLHLGVTLLKGGVQPECFYGAFAPQHACLSRKRAFRRRDALESCTLIELPDETSR